MNKQKIIYFLRLAFSAVVLICSFLAFTDTFYFFAYFFRLQLGAGIASLAASFSVMVLISVFAVLIFTFLFGRFYCSLICPLGILQDFINFFSLKKSKNFKNMYKTRYVIAAAVFSALLFGWSAGLKILDPYTNFGLIASSIFTPVYYAFGENKNYAFTAATLLISLIPFLILIFLVLFKRRFFCTAVCPAGTLLGLSAKYGIFGLKINDGCIKCGACFRNCPSGSINIKDKKIDNEICVRCLKCVSVCPKGAISYGICKEKKEEVTFSPNRRNFILGSLLVIGAIAAGAGSAAIRGKNFLQDKIRALLPPGAGDYNRFSSKCTSCQLCVAVCPGKVIHPRDFSHANVYMDYSENYCKYDCNKCTSVCPTGALKPLSLKEKQQTRLGLAKIDRDVCINCGICTFNCPVKALSLDVSGEERKLVYNASVCIGCGSCEVNCPHKAVKIVPIVKQTKIGYN